MATVRAVIPLFDQALRQNIATLAVLVGRAPADFSVKGGSIYRLGIPRVTPGLPSELLLLRPDIRAAEAQPRLRRRQRRVGPRGVLPEHLADRPGRLSERGAEAVVHAADRLLQHRRQHCAAAARRLPAGGTAGIGARPAIRAGEDLLSDDPLRFRRRGDRADRDRRQCRARAPAADRRQHRATGLPARRNPAARRHRRSTSPCCRPSRPCSRPRTICRSRVSLACRRCSVFSKHWSGAGLRREWGPPLIVTQ